MARSLRDLAWVGAALYAAAACGGQSVSIEDAPEAGTGGDAASGGVTGGNGGRNPTGGTGGSVGGAGGVNVTGGAGGGGGRGGKGGAGGKGGFAGFGGTAGVGGRGFAGKGGVGGFGGSAGTEIGGFGGTPDDLCTPNPCQNDGECNLDGEGSYSCACAPGYAGIICSVYVGYCQPGPCLNGGQCVDTLDSFRCECPPPYFGQLCQNVGSGCATEPCRNGGTCTDMPGGAYACSCPAGLQGPTCESGSITLSAVNRGWWDEAGEHDSTNDNTLTGHCSCDSVQTNSYFTFLLPDFSGKLKGVTLKLEIESYSSQDAAEAFTVYDVLTDAVTLEASGSGRASIPIFNDLMGGTLYTTFAVSAAQVGDVPNLPLLPAAVADVDANRGNYFSVGVHLATYGNRGPNIPEYVRFSSDSESRVHELVLSLE